MKNLRRTCTETSCDFWHPPVCLNHQSESGCMYGDKCYSAHLRLLGSPAKVKERWRSTCEKKCELAGAKSMGCQN